MADLVFRNTPYGDVTILDSWPQWLKDYWLALLKNFAPTAPPFVPKFIMATGSDGFRTFPLNSDYFATKETAQFVADKFGDGNIFLVPFGGTGGMYTASDQEYHFKTKAGRDVNAGFVAAYYVRNPEDQFPGLAEKLIREILGIQ